MSQKSKFSKRTTYGLYALLFGAIVLSNIALFNNKGLLFRYAPPAVILVVITYFYVKSRLSRPALITAWIITVLLVVLVPRVDEQVGLWLITLFYRLISF